MNSPDQNEFVRGLRNFVTITLLVIVVMALCFYITGALVSITINNNWEVLKAYWKLNWIEQFITIYKTMLIYWQYYFNNYDRLTWQSANYFVPKLWITTFLPYTILAIMAFVFRAPLMDFRPFKKEESIHGNAKWASARDVKKMGLRAKHGVLLGKYKGKLLVADGFQHVLLFAPTGSGKGVGFVIPNLLFWKDSTIVHDIKLENYELTSGYRKNKMKQKVFLGRIFQ